MSSSASSMSPQKRSSRPVIGVCAMDAKARSKPMRSILSRLAASSSFELCLFGDKTIMDTPPSAWPPCDFLIAFHSRGFPLDKAIQYVELNGPFCVNDVYLQQVLMDRRAVLAVLEAIDVPTPRRFWTNRDGGPHLTGEMMEALSRDFGIDFGGPVYSGNQGAVLAADGSVHVNGHSLKLPFVEKPVDAEDHNINVLLAPDKMCKLFRKIGNRSSELIADQPMQLRTGTDFVYEEFLKSDNSEDVKLYTVGPYYVYAESRKAPTKDGLVERNAEGKEIRYPTTVSVEEQEIARRVCMAFGQTVCGFDLLRCNGRSYVIDVNGWSFVKGNEEYYDRCARILRDTFLRVSRRTSLIHAAISGASEWRLDCYISIFRHADRTPKQKFKATIADLPDLWKNSPNKQLQEIHGQSAIKEFMNAVKSHEQLHMVLKKRYKTPGTKVQLHRKNADGTVSVSIKWGGDITHSGRHQAKDVGEAVRSELCLLLRSADHSQVLNSHNVHIHASRERRVVATANVFSKALLGISELPADFVNVDLLPPKEDDYLHAKALIDASKQTMLTGKEKEISQLMEILVEVRSSIMCAPVIKARWCCSDSPALLNERWERLCEGILHKKLDPSRIFDLYDSLKYDMIHHREFLTAAVKPDKLKQLVDCVQTIFNSMSAQQYGQNRELRLTIGRLLSGDLLCSIQHDLSRTNKYAFYFTKESQLNCLFSLLQPATGLAAIGELDYLSQIDIEVWRLYPSGEKSVRVGVRPGAHLDCLSAGFSPLTADHTLKVSQKRTCTEHIEFNQFLKTLPK